MTVRSLINHGPPAKSKDSNMKILPFPQTSRPFIGESSVICKITVNLPLFFQLREWFFSMLVPVATTLYRPLPPISSTLSAIPAAFIACEMVSPPWVYAPVSGSLLSLSISLSAHIFYLKILDSFHLLKSYA